MASDLLKDLKATNAYLRAHIDTCGDETAGGQVLAQQAQAFGQKLAQASITAEQATSLLHAVTEGPWQKAHKEVLAAAIDTGMRRAVTGKGPRRPNQNMPSFVPFLSARPVGKGNQNQEYTFCFWQ